MAYHDLGREPSTPSREIHEAPAPDPEQLRKKRNRNIALTAGIIVAIVVLILFLRHHAASQAQQSAAAAANARNRAVPVSVAPVQVRDVPVLLDGLGNVNALNTVTVKTRIDGQLLRFNFQEGQIVRAGEEIALIDPRPSEAQLAQAEAAKFKDVATLQNARHDLERYSALYKSGVIPQQQYNTQQSTVQVSEGSVKADDAQIQQSQLNIDYCHIKAPITGRVGIRFVDPGNIVHASDANGLVVIAQMQPIAVLFTLPEDQLSALTPHPNQGAGLPVEAWSRDNTQQIAAGRLLTIDNQIDPNTGTFRCKAIFDNKNGALFPNQFVNARLEVDVKKSALTVPLAAVQHGAQGTYVYTVSPEKTAVMRPVNIVLSEGLIAVVTGLNPGDQVVTDGADKLQPNGKVEFGGGRAASGERRAGGNGGGRKPQQ
jgi:membrane fusion protein, multidrug efflux system